MWSNSIINLKLCKRDLGDIIILRKKMRRRYKIIEMPKRVMQD